MKPIIYKSTDAGAPQLTVTAGAMNTVIKACLVTGYGSKAAAGWEIVHEDLATKKLAIRSTNIKSIKSVLLIHDTAAKKSLVNAFLEWDSLANIGVTSFGSGAFFKSMTGSPASSVWIIIATDDFFYLWTQNDASYPTLGAVSAFGDAVSFSKDRDYSVLMALGESASDTQANTTHNGVFASSDGIATFARSPYEQLQVGLGDRAKIRDSHATVVAALTPYVLYQTKLGKVVASLGLKGLLMPYGEIESSSVGGINIITNQHPYQEPIVSLRQPYAGGIWVHTDDWG